MNSSEVLSITVVLQCSKMTSTHNYKFGLGIYSTRTYHHPQRMDLPTVRLLLRSFYNNTTIKSSDFDHAVTRQLGNGATFELQMENYPNILNSLNFC